MIAEIERCVAVISLAVLLQTDPQVIFTF